MAYDVIAVVRTRACCSCQTSPGRHSEIDCDPQSALQPSSCQDCVIGQEASKHDQARTHATTADQEMQEHAA